MLIFDEENKVIEEPDYNLGRVEPRQRTVIQRYVVDEPARTHTKVIRTYPNGGKDVETIVDTPEAAHWETKLPETGDAVEFDDLFPDGQKTGEWVENIQNYYLFIPYTKEELEEIQKKKKTEKLEEEILERKNSLQETDYVAIKIMEGAATKEEYADILQERSRWRDEINELEISLGMMR